jgi:hypothetical protein
MNTSDKRAYVKPALNQIGSFEEVTLGKATGTLTDASFPAGTPVSSFTFS